MAVRYSKEFIKQLAKQPPKVQEAFFLRLRLFIEDPSSSTLRNHALKGALTGFYSINVTGDIRAIYEIVDDEIYLYQMIGSHSQLYR